MKLYKRVRATHALARAYTHTHPHINIMTNDRSANGRYSINTSIHIDLGTNEQHEEEHRKNPVQFIWSETVTVLMFVVVFVLWNVVCEVTHIIHTNSHSYYGIGCTHKCIKYILLLWHRPERQWVSHECAGRERRVCMRPGKVHRTSPDMNRIFADVYR